MQSSTDEKSSWLDRSPFEYIKLNLETTLFLLIIILAIITRFYNLGTRTMSHDENSHVYFSWLLEQGKGYKHDPVTHGPLQFHLLALSYLLFGDNDFTARTPAALLGIAMIAFMWFYRKVLGRAGALVGAALLLVSPYMLYYARYARNEAFVGLFGVVMLWAMLRYLEKGETRYMVLVTIANAFHYTSKETSFIYSAQALLFLAFLLVIQLFRISWRYSTFQKYFMVLVIVGIVFGGIGGSLAIFTPKLVTNSAQSSPTPVLPGREIPSSTPAFLANLQGIFIGIGLICVLLAAIFALRGVSLEKLREIRSLDLLIVIGTLVLPMLAPFPVRLLGYNPIEYTKNINIVMDAVFIGLLTILAILIGFIWKPRLWLINAAIFYAIFTVLYTTLFTNGFGFLTGLVGSLGYWLEQQGVNRGSQPWYFYALIQIPIYEYIPALGSLLAITFGIFWKGKQNVSVPVDQISENVDRTPNDLYDKNTITFALLSFWTFSSLTAFSVAGEKMPWLTFHITLPMILLTAWFLGNLIENTDWNNFKHHNGPLFILVLPIFLIAIWQTFSTGLSSNPPFQGKDLAQLQVTSTFLAACIGTALTGWLLYMFSKSWLITQTRNIVILAVFLFGSLFTARTAFMASYINYDNATEFLVYAHSTGADKTVLSQIEEISRRTTGGLGIKVAYDDETTYPYWWYFRNYPNQNPYGANPTREQRDAPVILVGEKNYGKIEPVVGQAYYQFDYIRLWWPNQDYFDINWDRFLYALTNSQMREAIFRIWFYRDYTLYGQLTNKDMSLTNWYPSSRMRLYIRKDVANKIWSYGTTASSETVIADPYEGKQIKLIPDQIFGTPGNQPGQFQKPRDLAIAADGTIYIADTDNNRIQHMDVKGNVLDIWGSFGDVTTGNAPGGTFYQPWGIAVGPDGSVYVADTWNHRIQKFTAKGEYVKMWGYFGQAETPEALWGPRDVLVDSQGEVYVSDTGNKRIVIYDQNGNFISQFGSAGLAQGQFDEPVGLALSSNNQLFVADTWNQRIQAFLAGSDGSYIPLTSWDIAGWYGQSLDNKPYLAVDNKNNLFATDPEGYRILQFTTQGQFIQYWGDYSTETDGFGLPSSVAVDPNGGVWVSDAGNNRIVHFTLP